MAANQTELQICNKALLRLAANQVESPDGRAATITTDSLEAKLCIANFAIIRDVVLEDRIWSFALSRAILDTPEVDAPEFGYQQQFKAPIDSLYIWRVDNQGFSSMSVNNAPTNQGIDWVLEGENILSDYDKLYIRYVRTLDSDGILTASNQFVDTLSLRLAVEMCMPLTENNTMQQALMAEYQQRLVDASSIDGAQATREIIRANSLKGARQGYGGGIYE